MPITNSKSSEICICSNSSLRQMTKTMTNGRKEREREASVGQEIPWSQSPLTYHFAHPREWEAWLSPSDSTISLFISSVVTTNTFARQMPNLHAP